MIFTSYFGKMRKFPKNVIPIAICAVVPNWYRGMAYASLAPKYDHLMKYKDDHNEADYIECYNNTILKYLNPLLVLHELEQLLPVKAVKSRKERFWESPDLHVVLLCYEKPSEFCHRQIVAKWLQNYGVKCEEWE